MESFLFAIQEMHVGHSVLIFFGIFVHQQSTSISTGFFLLPNQHLDNLILVARQAKAVNTVYIFKV